MRSIFRIRLRGMNARKAFHDLQEAPTDHDVREQVRALFLGPRALPDRRSPSLDPSTYRPTSSEPDDRRGPQP
jgi:hypothetical protein